MWLKQETKHGEDVTCPVCRTKIKDIKNNFSINGMIDSFLKIHPERARDKEELATIDHECKITDELLRGDHILKKLKIAHGDLEYDSCSSDEDLSEDDEGAPITAFHPAFTGLFPPGVNFPGLQRFPLPCLECTAAGPDGHQCAPGTPHFVCIACGRRFPDRTRELSSTRGGASSCVEVTSSEHSTKEHQLRDGKMTSQESTQTPEDEMKKEGANGLVDKTEEDVVEKQNAAQTEDMTRETTEQVKEILISSSELSSQQHEQQEKQEEKEEKENSDKENIAIINRAAIPYRCQLCNGTFCGMYFDCPNKVIGTFCKLCDHKLYSFPFFPFSFSTVTLLFSLFFFFLYFSFFPFLPSFLPSFLLIFLHFLNIFIPFSK